MIAVEEAPLDAGSDGDLDFADAMEQPDPDEAALEVRDAGGGARRGGVDRRIGRRDDTIRMFASAQNL